MRGARRVAPAAVAAAAVLLLAGCGHHGDTGQPAPASPSSSATDLGHLRKLVDDADTAAGKAESDMARE
ncbi:hypothetical protein [Streptomyces sp. NPDC059466]|uniref:hypothetical protein n=1 Tax=unclassified Streptomyces TaxID=2593676 RepID=UPI0036B74CC7